HDAVVSGEQHNNAVGFAKIISFDYQRAVPKTVPTHELTPLKLEAQAVQSLWIGLPVLQHLDAQIKEYVLAEDLDDVLARGVDDAPQALSLVSDDDVFLTNTLDVDDGV